MIKVPIVYSEKNDNIYFMLLLDNEYRHKIRHEIIMSQVCKVSVFTRVEIDSGWGIAVELTKIAGQVAGKNLSSPDWFLYVYMLQNMLIIPLFGI